MRAHRFVLGTVALLVGAAVLPAAAEQPARAGALEVLPGSYIVTLAPDAQSSPTAAAARAQALGGQVTHVYTSALRGYSVNLPQVLLSTLLADGDVASIEPDRLMRASASQPRAPYGLDRIDQRTLPLTGSYDYTATGAGVTAYVVDTGVRTSHRDFGGRAVSGIDTVDGGSALDCNGHGTHVAGTLAGTTYGVAKQARVVAVRVLNCEGSGATSGIIAGIDWVTAHHKPGQPAVANLSLGGGASRALDQAVQRSIADGISYVVAAGNGNAAGMPADACAVSPARVPEALTVGASDQRDQAAPFSNFGTCVDLYAPGVGIASAWFTGDTATNSISGTSMSSPHVAGVAALYLQKHRSATPAAVAGAVAKASTKDAVTSTRGSGGLGGLLGGSQRSPKSPLLYSRIG